LKKIFEKENKWITFSVISILMAFLVLGLVIYLGLNYEGTFSKIGALGPVGDLIGGSTVAFFNIASFLMLIAAIVMQKEELKLQRKELEMQRNELERTRKEHEITNRTMLIQRFENTFFNMLSLHNEIIALITYRDNYDNVYEGRRALTYIYNRFYNYYNRPTGKILDELKKAATEKERVEIIYSWFYKDYEDYLGHYFRNLYRIVKWINNSELTDKEKKEYIGILRAQLSKTELKLLFYNVISDKGKKFREFIIKYNIFDDHLGPSDLIDGAHFEFLEM
jgi:hypothetical protein